METYKNTLKRRMQLTGACCALVPVFLQLTNFLTHNAMSPLSDYDDAFVHGLSIGFTLLVLAATIYRLFAINRALKDEALLKQMYIKETDERRVFIQNKVGGTGMPLAVFLLAFAAVVACYFNIVITYTLMGAALFLALIMLGCKIYYRNKY